MSKKRALIATWPDGTQSEYESSYQAAEKLFGSQPGISLAARRNGYAYGALWRFKEPRKTRYPVSIDHTGKETAYASVIEAARACGVARQYIYTAIEKGGYAAKMKWRWENED